MKKRCIICALIPVIVFSLFQISAQSRVDFDKIVNFSLSLSDFDLTKENADLKSLSGKIVLLYGTLALITPSKPYGFLYNEKEILVPAVFIRKFEKPDDTISEFLVKQISAETKQLFGAGPDSEKLKAILADLNAFARRKTLYAKNLFAAVQIPESIKKLIALDLKEDEQAFLNRLLLDLVFKGIVKPVEIQAQIINGEWFDYERVESYSGLITLAGSEAFKVFSRSDSSALYSRDTIPLNSRILVVAKPLEIVKGIADNKDTWLFDGIYIRQLK